jgi:acyl-CoA reductase-like NAD-dependent aldehyde dehydrogenase
MRKWTRDSCEVAQCSFRTFEGIREMVEIDPVVTEFLGGKPKQLLIDGKWLAARDGKCFAAVNPATEQQLGEAAAGNAADVDLAVFAARRAFEQPSWAGMSPHERTKLLLKIATKLEENAEELAQIESLNNGMPLTIARMLVAGAVETFVYYAGWPTKMYGDTNPSAAGIFNYTLREPLGVCGQIVPWNGPIGSTAWKVAAALACGNTIVFKPAEQTPFSAIRFGELLLEAGVPPGVVNIVTGLGEAAGAAIASHPGIDKVAFTGSTLVGKKILMASAGNLKRVTLELGGKSPTLIFPDADLDAAALATAQGFCFLSGQICVAASRIFVHESVYDDFVERLSAIVSNFVPGDPLAPTTFMGPLVSRGQFDKVIGYLESGRAEGARVAAGGSKIKGAGYFVSPTVFADVDPSMRIVKEEIFGPVTAVMRFSEENEAIRIANDTAFGLAAAVWTNDLSRAQRVSRALRAGTVWINTYSHLDLISPFGGYKQSGLGRELGRHSLDAYTETKSVFAKYL